MKTTLQVQHETIEIARIEEAFAVIRRAEGEANLKQNRLKSPVSTDTVLSGEDVPPARKKQQPRVTEIVAAKTGQSRETVEKRLKIAKAVERQDPKAKEAMKPF